MYGDKVLWVDNDEHTTDTNELEWLDETEREEVCSSEAYLDVSLLKENLALPAHTQVRCSWTHLEIPMSVIIGGNGINALVGLCRRKDFNVFFRLFGVAVAPTHGSRTTRV